MREPRNEVEAWQEAAHALPPMPKEMREEYARGPSPIPAVIAIGGAIVLLIAAIYVFA